MNFVTEQCICSFCLVKLATESSHYNGFGNAGFKPKINQVIFYSIAQWMKGEFLSDVQQNPKPKLAFISKCHFPMTEGFNLVSLRVSFYHRQAHIWIINGTGLRKECYISTEDVQQIREQ